MNPASQTSARKATSQSAERVEQRRPKSAFYDHYAALAADTDFRKHPELYRVGRGEQGVLKVEPYKSELLPLWRFATPAVARDSAAALSQAFVEYLAAGDFVGADMARKFLQMGYTRARRYANHPGGRKYDPDGAVKPRELDATKAHCARIFAQAWQAARENPTYLKLKRQHQRAYG